MEYRQLPHGNEQISIVGLGTGSLMHDGFEEAVKTVETAIDQGINYIDLACAHRDSIKAVGQGISKKNARDKVYLQVHFGADYITQPSYGWTLDLNTVKKSIQWQLDALKTDYIDFGYIHCLDEQSDLDAFIANGTLDYMKDLKNKGIIRHFGLSSHTPQVVERVLAMDLVDMVMFSINAAYDVNQGDYAYGQTNERDMMYRHCQIKGVGIAVMKPFSAGQLLDDKTSPFHQAMTPYQCIQYALDRPGVLTVLPGVRNRKDLKDILGFTNADPKDKDYSMISSLNMTTDNDRCVYCNHCAPCPIGIDIGLTNKYYDLSMAGDDMAKDHYLHLSHHASECIHCHHCDDRCPFHVKQEKRMQTIASYFGI